MIAYKVSKHRGIKMWNEVWLILAELFKRLGGFLTGYILTPLTGIWVLVGFSSWSQFSAFLASVWSLILIGGWIKKHVDKWLNSRKRKNQSNDTIDSGF